MVPDIDTPVFSRRQVLSGLVGGVGVAGGGTLLTGLVRPTALPNVVADWATNHYPTPPTAGSLWAPSVTEAHAREAVTLLREGDAEAKARWEERDSDDGLSPGAGGWLKTAEESLTDGEYEDALWQAEYGMQFAGDDVGRYGAEIDAVDLEDLADRATDLLDRIDAVVDRLEPYPVSGPERDLAWYIHVELELQRGRHLAGWRGLEEVLEAREDDEAEGPDVSEYEPREVGDITEGILRAEIVVETAEQYYERLLEDVESGDPYGDHLRAVFEDVETELELLPTRDEVESEYIDDDVDPWGPYEFAHSRLATWCYPSGFTPPWRSPIDVDDFLLLGVLAGARGLADWRAHEFAVEELEIDPDDEDFDPGHVLAEQRRAKSTFEETIGSDPPPFLVVLAERGIGNTRVADIDRGSWEGRDHWTPWHERVQSYLNALLGRARLREYPAIYEQTLERTTD